MYLCINKLKTQSIMKKFVLLRNKTFGNVYWTTNSLSKTDDLEILFESDDVEEMI